MGYTVSGVSRIIASLEDEVGFPLLIRGHRGVVPTVDCQRLLPAAEGLALPAQDEMSPAVRRFAAYIREHFIPEESAF